MSTPDEQTSRPLTRRELRELRAKGIEPESVAPAHAGTADDAQLAGAAAPADKGAKGSSDAAQVFEDAAPKGKPAEGATPAKKNATPASEKPEAAPAHRPLTRREMRQLRTNEVPIVSAELVSSDAEDTPPLTQPEKPVETTVFEIPQLDPSFGAGVSPAVTRENMSFDALIEQPPTTSPSSILETRSHRLPEGVGSTGAAIGTTDGREVDAVLIDGELPAASSPTPIAASSAISTQKSAAEVLRPPAPEKGRGLLLILGITAGVLGIVAIGTLATLYFTGALN